MSYIPILARLEPAQKEALDRVRRQSGAPISYHVRKAVEEYLLNRFSDIYQPAQEVVIDKDQ